MPLNKSNYLTSRAELDLLLQKIIQKMQLILSKRKGSPQNLLITEIGWEHQEKRGFLKVQERLFGRLYQEIHQGYMRVIQKTICTLLK